MARTVRFHHPCVIELYNSVTVLTTNCAGCVAITGNYLATWCDIDFLQAAFSNDGKGNRDSDTKPQYSLEDFKHIVKTLHLPIAQPTKEQNRELVALLLLFGWLVIGSVVYWCVHKY